MNKGNSVVASNSEWNIVRYSFYVYEICVIFILGIGKSNKNSSIYEILLAIPNRRESYCIVSNISFVKLTI